MNVCICVFYVCVCVYSIPLHVLKDVALVVPCAELEGESGVVTLQHGCVVV